LDNFEPLVIERGAARGSWLPSSFIPIASVPVVTLLAMKPSVDPRAGGAGDLLAKIVGFVPSAFLCQPERAKLWRKFGGGVIVVFGREGETVGVHYK
jgi:hypothetical protein